MIKDPEDEAFEEIEKAQQRREAKAPLHTHSAWYYYIEGDNSQPVLTHKRQDWAERYPHWREVELVPKLVQEPVIDKSAAVRIATALGWEPKREWKTLTDAQYQDILKQTEGCGHLAFYHLIDKALREANT